MLIGSCVLVLVIARSVESLAFPQNGYLLPEIAVTIDGERQALLLENGVYRGPDENPLQAMFQLDPSPGVLGEADRTLLISAVRRKIVSAQCGDVELAVEFSQSPVLFKGFDPHVISLDKACQDSGIRIEVDGGEEPALLRRLFIGEKEPIGKAFRWRRFWGVDAIIISTGVALLAAFIALAALPLARDSRLYLTFGLMMGFWALRNIYYIGPLDGLSLRAADTWFYGTTAGLMWASALFVNEWTFQLRWVRRWAAPAIGVSLAIAILSIALGSTNIAESAGAFCYLAGLICLIFMLGQHAACLLRLQSPPYLETFLFMTGALAGLMDLLGTVFPSFAMIVFGETGLSMPFSPQMSSLAAYAMLLFVGRRNRSVQLELATSNQRLSRDLKAREREIRQAYADREKQARESVILRERQRIMDDIHDGFGGRLLALLLQAEKGSLATSQMKSGLRDSIQDLRLIVDSLDTADGDLALAMGALRGRIEPQLNDAELTLNWDVKVDGQEHSLGPRAILSIYRMIQEATANCIRHANATSLDIIARWSRAQDLEIIISDDGDGMRPNHQPGRGLISLKNRARDLGGTVAISSAAGGVTLKIVIPAHPFASGSTPAS